MIIAVDSNTLRTDLLPKAPTRATLAEAEADEAIGVELAAFLAKIKTLTAEQWIAVGELAHSSPYPTTARLASMNAADKNGLTLAWSQASLHAWWTTRKAWSAAAGPAAVRELWRIESPLINSPARAAEAIVARQFITGRQFGALTKPLREAAAIDFDNLT